MKFILLVVLGFLAFSFVEAGDPWSCSLGCTDRYVNKLIFLHIKL